MFSIENGSVSWENLLSRMETRISVWIFSRRKDGGLGVLVARPDPELCCVPMSLTWFSAVSPSRLVLGSLSFLVSLPFPRLRGLPAGLTPTTLPSDRAAWTRLPAGLATCRWSTHRWGSTLSSLKTRSLFWGKNTETLSDFEEPGRVGEGKREGPGVKLLSLPSADPLSRWARLCQVSK